VSAHEQHLTAVSDPVRQSSHLLVVYCREVQLTATAFPVVSRDRETSPPSDDAARAAVDGLAARLGP
jgi:hypothetical protein